LLRIRALTCFKYDDKTILQYNIEEEKASFTAGTCVYAFLLVALVAHHLTPWKKREIAFKTKEGICLPATLKMY